MIVENVAGVAWVDDGEALVMMLKSLYVLGKKKEAKKCLYRASEASLSQYSLTCVWIMILSGTGLLTSSAFMHLLWRAF